VLPPTHRAAFEQRMATLSGKVAAVTFQGPAALAQGAPNGLGPERWGGCRRQGYIGRKITGHDTWRERERERERET